MSTMNMRIMWTNWHKWSRRSTASATCVIVTLLVGCSPQKPATTVDAAPATLTGRGAAPAPPQAPAAPDAPGTPGATAPAPVMTSPPTRVVSNDGGYIVLFTTTPDPIPTNDPFTVSAKIYDARRGQQLVTDADVVVDAAMPEHRHGMNVVPRVRKLNDGSYVATGLVFHMPGRWELYIDITRKGETERAQAEIVLE